jgi:hypothetical protein
MKNADDLYVATNNAIKQDMRLAGETMTPSANVRHGFPS